MDQAPGLSRYHRQTLLPGVGDEGQRRLLASHVLIVGCGALGCAIADLLARAGVGTLTIVDRDIVEPTNLQRQCLFGERDAAEGLPKAEAASRRIAEINSDVRVRAIVADFDARNAERVLREAAGAVPVGAILDGTDNFETRYLMNDLAVRERVPLVYGGAVGTRGMAMTIIPGTTPCLRCLFEQPPPAGSTPTCDTAGVLGAASAIIGACQSADAIKILLGRSDLLPRTLLEFDLWANTRRRIELGGPRADCPCCGLRRFEFLDGAAGGATASLCGQDAVQVNPAGNVRVDLAALASRLGPHGRFEATRFLIRGTLDREIADGGTALGLTVFADGRAVVRGTRRSEVARAVYARYVGV